MKKTLLLDADGVILNFTAACSRLIADVTGVTDLVHDQWDVCADPRVAPHKKTVYKRLGERGFCAGIEPYPGARKALARLREMADVHVVTSPWHSSRHWVYERTESLKKHFGFEPHEITHTSAKQRVFGHVLVDDKPENVQAWAQAHPLGRVVLWDQLYNRDAAVPAGGIRANNWGDVIAFLKRVT